MTQPTISRGLRYGLALTIATSVIAPAAPALSEPTPIPKAAPKAARKDGAVQPASQDKAPATTGTTQAPPNPIIPDPRRNVPTNIFASFYASQKAQAAKVSSYLSSLQTLVG